MLPPRCVPHKKMPHTVDVRLDHRPVRPVHRYPLQSATFSFDLSTLFFYIFYQPVFSEEHIIRSKMRIVAFCKLLNNEVEFKSEKNFKKMNNICIFEATWP